jgi:hypothetical protein
MIPWHFRPVFAEEASFQLAPFVWRPREMPPSPIVNTLLDQIFRKANKLRPQLNLDYEESSDDSNTLHSRDRDRTISDGVPVPVVSEVPVVPEHLVHLHQPEVVHELDNDSLGDGMHLIFEPPKPSPPAKALLAAAQKAALAAADKQHRQTYLQFGILS